MSDDRAPDASEHPDPFEGLVLDEDFVRSATVTEPSARTRMLTARWRREAPVDPGGRRWASDGPAKRRSGGRFTRLRQLSRGERWTMLLALLIVGAVVGGLIFGPSRAGAPVIGTHSTALPGKPGKASDAALPDGGTFVGSKCGEHGYHHFADAAASVTVQGAPGPGLVFSSYGYRASSGAPAEFTFDLVITAGGAQPLDLAAPLGKEGVAVEIEGPDGLVAAAYGLPVTLGQDTVRTPQGQVRVTDAGTAARLVLPAAALCPGIDAEALSNGLAFPVDAHNTVSGPAPYTLTVSLADPAVGELRRSTGAKTQGQVLSTTNQLAPQGARPV
ncbi:hypothetical protein AB0K51_05015 [Kitasatospora sp. NPDC049285]|uniref:SCO2583/SCO2584 N-terminal domain-containing protein n=1 Tax=Kitasatospora sp. NPDC049285 TaxID=3157096 RepID=UPI00341F32FE